MEKFQYKPPTRPQRHVFAISLSEETHAKLTKAVAMLPAETVTTKYNSSDNTKEVKKATMQRLVVQMIEHCLKDILPYES